LNANFCSGDEYFNFSTTVPLTSLRGHGTIGRAGTGPLNDNEIVPLNDI
jgi:hypothetical protein